MAIGMAATVQEGAWEVAAEERLRADLYRMFAHFLRKPPDDGDLRMAAGLGGGDTALGEKLAAFAHLAETVTAADAAREYHELFIGMGRGELLPYASYYLTGFLHEKPLAKLRTDMGELGIARRSDVKEPEDHIAALSEMMAGLIDGAFAEPAGLDVQKRFFARHLEPWAAHFFKDLEAAKSSVLYAPLGGAGAAFMAIEQAAFEMV